MHYYPTAHFPVSQVFSYSLFPFCTASTRPTRLSPSPPLVAQTSINAASPSLFLTKKNILKRKIGEMGIGNGILKYFPFIFLCVLLTSGMPTQFPHVNPTSPPMMIPATSTPTPSWCVANAAASQVALQVGLDYACGYGGSDCSAIQPGGSCYEPNTVADHASYAFNEYYQKNPARTSCVFGGTSQLTNIDPSHNNCRYSLPRTLSSTSSTVIPTPSSTRMPAGATIYGSESAAKSSSPALAPNYYILLPTMATLLPLIFLTYHQAKTLFLE